METDQPPFIDAAMPQPHAMRITSGGSIRSWVAFALKFFEFSSQHHFSQENEAKPLILHTFPPSHSAAAAAVELCTTTISAVSATNQAVERSSTNIDRDDSRAAASIAVEQHDTSKTTPADSATTARSSNSPVNNVTNGIPRLLTVAEIIKREYLKGLAQKKQSRLLGLYQYNEVGYLEEVEADAQPDEGNAHNHETNRSERITAMLQGKEFPRMKQTPYMRVILCGSSIPHLSGRRITYQPPVRRKISKSARSRARKRGQKEKAPVAAD